MNYAVAQLSFSIQTLLQEAAPDLQTIKEEKFF